jgi:hypothetical protein
MNNLLDSTGLIGDSCALRIRYHRDGYLLLRGVLQVSTVAYVRDMILNVLIKNGWVDSLNHHVMKNQARGDGSSEYYKLYPSIFSLEGIHDLAHGDSLLSIAHTLLGGEILVHPRIVVRLIIPGNDCGVTPPHQDYSTVRGTPNFCTIWTPLTDKLEQGGLAIAVGSHRLGPLPASSREIQSVSLHDCFLDWAVGRVSLGDVLIFHGLTIHKTIRNKCKQIRISLDVRMQRISDPVHPAAFLLPDYMSWDSVYSGWKRSDLLYYWRNLDLNYWPTRAKLKHASLNAQKEELRAWAQKILVALDG